MIVIQKSHSGSHKKGLSLSLHKKNSTSLHKQNPNQQWHIHYPIQSITNNNPSIIFCPREQKPSIILGESQGNRTERTHEVKKQVGMGFNEEKYFRSAKGVDGRRKENGTNRVGRKGLRMELGNKCQYGKNEKKTKGVIICSNSINCTPYKINHDPVTISQKFSTRSQIIDSIHSHPSNQPDDPNPSVPPIHLKQSSQPLPSNPLHTNQTFSIKKSAYNTKTKAIDIIILQEIQKKLNTLINFTKF